MDDHGYTGKQLAEKCGMQPSLISRIKTGEQKYVAKDDLAKLTACFLRNQHTGESTPYDPAQLVRAHLLDEKVGVGSELVDVTIKHPTKDETIPPKICLSPEADRAITVISNFAAGSAGEPLVIELAKVLGMFPKKGKE